MEKIFDENGRLVKIHTEIGDWRTTLPRPDPFVKRVEPELTNSGEERSTRN